MGNRTPASQQTPKQDDQLRSTSLFNIIGQSVVDYEEQKRKWEEEKKELMKKIDEEEEDQKDELQEKKDGTTKNKKKKKTLCHPSNEQKLITAIEMIKKQHPLKDKITISNAFPFLKKTDSVQQGLGWGSFNEFDKDCHAKLKNKLEGDYKAPPTELELQDELRKTV